MAISISFLLIVLALIFTIVSVATPRWPLWPAVLLLCIEGLIRTGVGR